MAEERVQRRLAAILAVDMVGYSRLIGADEEGTIARQKTHRAELIDPEIANHGGRIVKTMGDGLLVEFASVVDAIKCAVAVQQAMSEREADVPKDRRIQYRVGVNLGDIVIDGEDILGDGVNVAARLEGLADPGGICVSGSVYEQVQSKLDIAFEDMGTQHVKNIAKPMRAYQVKLSGVPSQSLDARAFSHMPSIAVLPFDNLSGDSEQEFFADGLTEDLITALSYWHTFYVIARHSTFQYKGQSPDIHQVAHDLGVQYVLEGSVRKAGDRVRVTAQLIDTGTGRHVWAERYDRQLKDFFDLQDEITQEIAAKVEPAFAKAEQQKAIRKATTNLAAWEWYQRGIATLDGFFKAGNVQGKAANIQARECFQRAMELDPTDSRPVAYLAYAHFRSVLEGYSSEPETDIAKNIEFAKRAIALDDDNPYAHFAYSIGLTYSGQPELGVPEARRAVELNPNYSHAYIPLGNGLNLAGEPADGVRYLEKAIKLNPTDPRNFAYFTFLAEAHLNNRDYEQAIEWSRKAIERNFDYPHSHFVLAAALGHMGQVGEASRALNDCLKLRPDFIQTHPQLPLFRKPADREHILDGLRKAGWSQPMNVAEPQLPDKPSIAVLPFDNMSGDPEQEYFSHGITEDIITDLSKISSLFVIARNTAFTYKGRAVDVKKTAEELGVRYVVEGSVRKAGNRIRITAQLVDGDSGGHIWADRYDRDLADIFAVQDEVTETIVNVLKLHLTPQEQERIGAKGTENIEAYDYYLRGRDLFHQFTAEATAEARRLFEEAIRLAPDYGAPYSGNAVCIFNEYLSGWNEANAQTFDRGIKMAQKAVEIDPNDAVAHWALALGCLWSKNLDEAEHEIETSLRLDPNFAEGYATRGHILSFAGRPDEAIESLEYSMRLNPQFPKIHLHFLAQAYFMKGNYQHAAELLERRIRLNPSTDISRVLLAACYGFLDRVEDAQKAWNEALEINPKYSLEEKGKVLPYKNPGDWQLVVNGLRRANVPES